MANNSKKQKKKRVNNIPKYSGFFAFPSEPNDSKITIEKAVKLVNQNNFGFELRTWTDMEKSSSRIISNILESIEQSDILIADISDLNPNVLFEVGYAFGLGKKLLMYTQGFSSISRRQDIDDIEIIGGFEIETYESSIMLATKIKSKFPSIYKQEPEILKCGYNPNISIAEGNALFLQGVTSHDFAIASKNSFCDIFPNCTIDDWNEEPRQSLLFYLKEIEKSSSIIALFVNPTWNMSRKVNARFSFICGIALAMNRNILMIGLTGFVAPFDYKEIMVFPKDEQSLKKSIENRFILNFSEPTVKQLPEFKLKNKKINDLKRSIQSNKKTSLSKDDKEIILIDINIGNPVAENEETELSEYFVKTGQYYEALKSNQAIIIGNKGSGKTACFYQIREYYKENSKNLICEIKPSDYKMERFLDSLKLLNEKGNGLVGHVLGNVWKTVIYCSLIEALENKLKSRPSYVSITPDEDKFLVFVSIHKQLIFSSFEQKLETACNWLKEVSYNVDDFSRIIHENFLSESTHILMPLLKQVNKTIIILDNLDKAWDISNDLIIQSELFFNLLGFHRKLKSDFSIADVSILIFLRRNIYECIRNRHAREGDKLILDTIELQWEDKEALLRVLEERFLKTIQYWKKGAEINPWEAFFKLEEIKSIKDWLYETVLPRPRDLIRFVSIAIEKAINHNHSEIEESDLQSALYSYSSFALDQIIAEYKSEEPWIRSSINSFIGRHCGFKYQDLFKIIKNQHVDINNKEIIRRIKTLLNINFIGIQLNNSPVLYAYSIQNSEKLISIIDNIVLRKKAIFIINPVFYKHLDIIKNIKVSVFKKFKGLFK